MVPEQEKLASQGGRDGSAVKRQVHNQNLRMARQTTAEATQKLRPWRIFCTHLAVYLLKAPPTLYTYVKVE